MKKGLLLLLWVVNFPINGEVNLGFQGCGEYVFKGEVFTNKNVKNDEFPMEYKVNIGTKSQMTFKFKKEEDALLVAQYLKKPTQFTAEITEAMDGTLGYIDNIKKIGLRFPDPLHPLTDSGIFLQSKKECIKKEH